MSVATQTRMTVDDFLAWAESQPGRHELYNGVVYAMSPERAVHAKTKFAIQAALQDGIRKAGVPCHMLPDGMTVRADKFTAHEPDALVYCGPELPGAAIEVPNPVIVVEVLSPSTRSIDAALKLATYFQVASVAHYLIVDPQRPVILLHTRAGDGTIITRIIRDDSILLDPPGIELSLADVIRIQREAESQRD
jgi:Uma2 family endonuclease